MNDPHQAAAQAAQEFQRVLELFAPNATNVQIETVNQNPREMEFIDFYTVMAS